MNTPTTATAFTVLLSFLFLVACEPMTEAEMAAYQKRQAEVKVEQERIASAREESCRSDLTQFICADVRERVIQKCQQQVKEKHEYTRQNRWGDTSMTSKLSYFGVLSDFGGTTMLDTLGNYYRLQLNFQVTRLYPSGRNIDMYYADCLVKIGDLDRVLISNERPY